MMFFPFENTDWVLKTELTTSHDYELIVPSLVSTGMDDICKPLAEFLTVALVKPDENNSTPLTIQQQVGLAHYAPGPADVSCRWNNILYYDLPGLLPSGITAVSDPALMDVTHGVRDMATESCVDHNDHTDSCELAHCPQTIHEQLGDAKVTGSCPLAGPSSTMTYPLCTMGVMHSFTVCQIGGCSNRPSTLTAIPLGLLASMLPQPRQWPSKTFFVGSACFDIGTDILPFSITPSDATSHCAHAMLVADRVRLDAFYLGGDPESSAIAPSEVSHLQM
jgi:hypothetical protein